MSTATEEITIEKLIKSLRMDWDEETALIPIVQEERKVINEDVSDAARFASTLAALIWNVDRQSVRLDKAKIQEVISRINEMINDQINEIIHKKEFKELESSWMGLFDIAKECNFNNVDNAQKLDFLDVSKEELQEDFEKNSVDFTGSSLFSKVYSAEYDQFGGEPFGSIIGLYKFDHTPADEEWLKIMSKIAAASHAPFVSSVSTQFFGCETIEELAAIKDFKGLMSNPKYASFNAIRETEESAYLGLCLPSYVQRLPWDPVKNPCGDLNFTENMKPDDKEKQASFHDNSKYSWGNAAVLFAKNLYRSFDSSGWCQYLRGPKGGGLIMGLPVHTFSMGGKEEIKIPVEMVIPGYRELEFAECGFIPLVYRKNSGEACFFSTQSLKKPKAFVDPKDSENAQMVCNLSYTYSITRIAHYVKIIALDNVGSSADAPYLQGVLSRWIENYTTAITNPDNLTLRRFPFKAATISVKEQEGNIGWYSCSICILPHIQMEGLDAELRLESRLG
ncbi:MAG: type VI secretion system contractile sheath large subunit [Candidatus Algichlamydia australiensis]|nr:type VI secretion system contractile sheath large subunit [Chlamydiales bacterium]